MWRLLGALLAVSLFVGMAAFHGTGYAQSGTTPEHKQLICHVDDEQGAIIIEVADPAVPKHLEKHGDCLINSTDRSLIGDECDATDANTNDICDIQP